MPDDQVKIKKQSYESDGMVCCSDGDHYPYGTSLRLDKDMIEELGIDSEMIGVCVGEEETQSKVEEWIIEANKTGVYGTPTVFIDDTAVVGPKPYRVYRRLITGSWL